MMSWDSTNVSSLVRRLQQAHTSHLNAAELDALLGWLCGGQRHGAQEIGHVLGQACNSPQTVKTVYRLLDARLLAHGRLEPTAAHLTDDLPAAERKARFRRLIQAFHPDRYPELAAWLTPRAQMIHEAYAAYKRGEPWPTTFAGALDLRPNYTPQAGETRARAYRVDRTAPDHPWQPGPFRHSARLVPDSPRPVARLVAALQRSPMLARLLMGVFALVTLTPMLVVYLSDDRAPVVQAAGDASSVNEQTPSPAALNAQNMPTPAKSAGMLAERDERVGHHSKDGPLILPAASPQGQKAREDLESTRDERRMPERHSDAVEAQITLLLQSLGHYVSRGDLDSLMRLADESYVGEGADSLAQHYGRIITESRRRHQEFRVLSIERQSPYWSVLALSRLTMAFDDLTARHEEARYQVLIREDEQGQLRIAGFDG